MGFLGKLVRAAPAKKTTREQGNAAEDAALEHLQQHGLHLLVRNYRTPGRGGGEIDLIMREKDGTVVFVEVRLRRNAAFGGAGSSIHSVKQKRLVFAARHYLLSSRVLPPCRFDVVLVEQDIEWIRAAFNAS